MDLYREELRECLANMYFSFCKGKFCKGCILNKKENSEYTFCKLHYLLHELYGKKEKYQMNYYKQIAEMLGLELGEKFKLRIDEATYCDDTFYFSEYGLKDVDSIYNCNELLDEILRGKPEIVKLPWKPKKDEQYWYYSIAWESALDIEFNSSIGDLLNWKVGNCFKTKEEALVKGKEIMEQIKKEYEEA